MKKMRQTKVPSPFDSSYPGSELDRHRVLQNNDPSDEQIDELIREKYPRSLDHFNRRDFLKLMGASLAAAGLTSCIPQSSNRILPYSEPPEVIIPGKPVYFASAMPRDGYGYGVLIKTDMGRPIKVDGNPRHPVSKGSSDVFMQASILDLYDPDRARTPSQQGSVKTWDDFATELAARSDTKLRILTGPITSPTMNDLILQIQQKHPLIQWHQYSPVDCARDNQLRAFNNPVDVTYRFDQANVILSLDGDFLFAEPGSLQYRRDFAARRDPNGKMSRLYVVENSMSLTGASADHRLAMRSSDIEGFARSLAIKLNVPGIAAADLKEHPASKWIDPVAADLLAAGSNALVVAGRQQPPQVHALVFAINEVLGNNGTTVSYSPPVMSQPVDQIDSLKSLIEAMNSGSVESLLILDGNPVYSTPADFGFAAALKKVPFSAYLGAYFDETASLTSWHIPAAHYLESWGDIRSFDGTTSIIQPLIEPIYSGKSALEVLSILIDQPNADGYMLVKSFWQKTLYSVNYENTWRQALADGTIPNPANVFMPLRPSIKEELLSQPYTPPAADDLVLVFEPDATIWDGQYANNAWLQEVAKPVTKLCWDNAAVISPQTAEKLGLKQNELVALTLRGQTVQAPVFIEPGQADQAITVSLGYGRTAGGKVLEATGFNAYLLRSSDALWYSGSLQIQNLVKEKTLATIRDHQTMEGRDLFHTATLAGYQADPRFAADHELPSLYPPVQYNGYSWGMVINPGACIGCNACILACQSENNIPTVGKEQVLNGREMFWLRIDRYYAEKPQDPVIQFDPVPCMHCENAPCEPVCPVEATSHSAEGINEMTYNRCVGTRYCSSNCPYKVRRFNFLKYQDGLPEELKAMHNPDVTIRMRGVMEKCTYCIQRIQSARIQSEVEGRSIRDGEILTACQQACPTHAIVFGNINDAESEVTRLKASDLNYGLLYELNTKPRTTYLAKITNPNPQLAEGM